MANPFYEDVDDAFRGVRVHVHASEHAYARTGPTTASAR